jgi:4,5-dihydroxyphthalate decarboxylase
MARLSLTLACGDYDRTRPLADGSVRAEGVDLNVLFLPPEETFHRMARFRDFDASEFSLSSYTVLRGRGESLVAIPAFPSYMFRHNTIYVRADAGIAEPRDLRGKRVGVPKYHMTAAVWIRGMLEDEYGVAPKEMLWYEGGEGARIKEIDVTLPAEIRRETVPADRTLSDLLDRGELDAYIGARRPPAFTAGSPRIRRLFPDFRAAERAYYQKTGLFPIMHTVVLRAELVERHPWLATSLLEAFAGAKAVALRAFDQTAALPAMLPWFLAEAEETRALFGDDPFPYGVARTRRTVETLSGYTFRQGLAPRRLTAEEMFVPSTLAT